LNAGHAPDAVGTAHAGLGKEEVWSHLQKVQ